MAASLISSGIKETSLNGHSRLIDKYGRAITDLRVSVTDRCNYKCVYCRTGNDGAQYADLPLADYLRIVRVFVSLGIEKVRLTGGEPLLRKGLTELVRELAKLRRVSDGTPLDLALTTNGHLLEEMAQPLKDAGLGRVTVSMDAVDPEIFTRITRVPGSFHKVLAGIRAAHRVGLGTVKVNCVLLRGFNEEQIVPFAKFAREEGVIVRFIEFMPLEEDRLWTPEVVIPVRELLERLSAFRPVVVLEANTLSETARRYTFDDGVGEIGIIAPVSQAFCGHCSRIRLTSDGKIRTCLFSQFDHDLYGRMQRGATDEEMASFIRVTVEKKEARHHIGEPDFLKPSRSMVHIGG
ncbi:MAG TPA: GTP 3',8-cyclase MoaA [Pseudacidobacterium sp.]|jgi:cyclic pyranopterin phosphate synthase|nr:GTP 3',8-cyclase MoaA [Pseudacidobacterium sp.]